MNIINQILDLIVTFFAFYGMAACYDDIIAKRKRKLKIAQRPPIGTYKREKKFAWLPKNLFPQYLDNNNHTIWLKYYYKIYQWQVKTWNVSDPDSQGWVWLGNTKNKKWPLSILK